MGASGKYCRYRVDDVVASCSLRPTFGFSIFFALPAFPRPSIAFVISSRSDIRDDLLGFISQAFADLLQSQVSLTDN
jgi:hypothetical protein